jgi:hypothetical protein
MGRSKTVWAVQSASSKVFGDEEWTNPIVKELLRRKISGNMEVKDCILNCMNYGSKQMRSYYRKAVKQFEDEPSKLVIGGETFNREPIIQCLKDLSGGLDTEIINMSVGVPETADWASWYLQENCSYDYTNKTVYYNNYLWCLDSISYNAEQNIIECCISRDDVTVTIDENGEEIVTPITVRDVMSIQPYKGERYIIVKYSNTTYRYRLFICLLNSISSLIGNNYELYLEQQVSDFDVFPLLTLREYHSSYKTAKGRKSSAKTEIDGIKKQFTVDFPRIDIAVDLEPLEVSFPTNFPSSPPVPPFPEHTQAYDEEGNPIINSDYDNKVLLPFYRWRKHLQDIKDIEDYENYGTVSPSFDAYQVKAKKLQKCLNTLNLDLDYLVDKIEENENISKITAAFLLFGLSFDTKSEVVSKLLYKTFNGIYEKGFGNTRFDDNRIYAVYTETPFRYYLSWLLNTPPEIKEGYLEKKYTHELVARILDIIYQVEVHWVTVEEGMAQIATITKNTYIDGILVKSEPYGDVTVDGDGNYNVPSNSHKDYLSLVISHRLSPTQYHVITLEHLEAISTVISSNHEEGAMIGVEDKHLFFIPLLYSHFTELNIFERSELMHVSLTLWFNAVDKQYLKWYQDPLFIATLTLIGLVITFVIAIYNAPVGAAATTYWLSFMASLLITMILLPLALKAVWRSTDNPTYRAMAVAAAFAISAYVGGAGMTFNTVIGLINLAVQIADIYIQADLERLQRKGEEFNVAYKERMEAFKEVEDKLKSTLTQGDIYDICMSTGVPPPVMLDFSTYIYLSTTAGMNYDLLYGDFYNRMLTQFYDNQLEYRLG